MESLNAAAAQPWDAGSRLLEMRYRKAIHLTAPRIAGQTPGLRVRGYWLDEETFFFLSEHIDAPLQRIVTVASRVNPNTGTVTDVLPFDELASILWRHTGGVVDKSSLAQAEIDMPDRHTLAICLGKREYLVDLKERRVTREAQALGVAALYSADGRYACFIEGYNLWLHDRHTGLNRALTTDGIEHNAYGRESETALATLLYRDRPYPLGLWSADSQWFLTQRIDERAVPELPIVQHVPPRGARPTLHTVKYAMSGDATPIATYVAIHIESGRVVSFDDIPGSIPTLSTFTLRSAWFDGPDIAWFVRADRHSRQLDLVKLHLREGTARIVLSESTPSGYLDAHQLIFAKPNVRTLFGGNEAVWYSERDGWGHLYLYDLTTGQLKNPITCGAWSVRDIVHVDAVRREVLFLAAGIELNVDPAHRSLCRASLDGSGFEVLLKHEGDIEVALTEPYALEQERPYRPAAAPSGLSPKGHFVVARRANVDANETVLLQLSTRQASRITSVTRNAADPRARCFSALAADGTTPVHGVLFLPSDFDETSLARLPLIDYIYPGPHLTHQPQTYRAVNAAPALSLAELGFATVMMNTRAMPVGSRANHQIGFPKLQDIQLADHAAVIRQLLHRFPFLNDQRVGMIGYSAGGRATVRALCEQDDLYKVGVAVAGYNDAGHLPALWVDKYRGPREPGSGLDEINSSIAHQLTGKLFLVAADLDENVHLAHTLSVVDALIRAHRDFELLIVPNERHSLLMTSGYAQRRIWDFLIRNLLELNPPAPLAVEFTEQEIRRCEMLLLNGFRQ